MFKDTTPFHGPLDGTKQTKTKSQPTAKPRHARSPAPGYANPRSTVGIAS